MNDFTKEELICIRDNLVVPETHSEKSMILSAYHKLIEMIVNYCEHQETVVTGGWTYQCIKCGMKFGDETQ